MCFDVDGRTFTTLHDLYSGLIRLIESPFGDIEPGYHAPPKLENPIPRNWAIERHDTKAHKIDYLSLEELSVELTLVAYMRHYHSWACPLWVTMLNNILTTPYSYAGRIERNPDWFVAGGDHRKHMEALAAIGIMPHDYISHYGAFAFKNIDNLMIARLALGFKDVLDIGELRSRIVKVEPCEPLKCFRDHN